MEPVSTPTKASKKPAPTAADLDQDLNKKQKGKGKRVRFQGRDRGGKFYRRLRWTDLRHQRLGLDAPGGHGFLGP